MLSTFELLLVMLGILGVAHLFRNQEAREQANATAKRFCKQNHLQFLDGTVSLTSIRFSRRFFHLARHYRFEYSTDRVSRFVGSITIIGRTQSVYVDPDHSNLPPVDPDQSVP